MNTPRISIIVALSDNRVIGNKGEIPWNIPGEQKRVKEITTPHPLIMGRKTHESIGRILSGRLNIIVTSDKDYTVEGGVVVHSLEQAFDVAQKAEQERVISSASDTSAEVFVFGGGNLYQQAMSHVDRLYLTIVHKTVEGDAYFPEYPEFRKIVSKEEKEFEGPSRRGEPRRNLRYTYLTLDR